MIAFFLNVQLFNKSTLIKYIYEWRQVWNRFSLNIRRGNKKRMDHRKWAWRIRFLHNHRSRERTYHWLLLAAPDNSPGRLLILSSLDEEISIDGELYHLAVHQYPDKIFPEGFKHLVEFNRNPFPLWIYQAGDFTVKKKVFMVHNSNTTFVVYDITSQREGALLRIFPL